MQACSLEPSADVWLTHCSGTSVLSVTAWQVRVWPRSIDDQPLKTWTKPLFSHPILQGSYDVMIVIISHCCGAIFSVQCHFTISYRQYSANYLDIFDVPRWKRIKVEEDLFDSVFTSKVRSRPFQRCGLMNALSHRCGQHNSLINASYMESK